MKTCTIPSTTLKSSLIAFGTDSIGTRIDKKESFQMLSRYVASGGNHIDTAHIYGGGQSESTLGAWMKESGLRNQLLLATKGAHPNPTAMEIPRLSRSEIESDLDESLLRLGCDHVDLYWLHRDCASVPVADIVDSLNCFVKKGKIRYFGCSNWMPDRIREANAYADATNQLGFCASQIKWSLAPSSANYIDDPTLVEMDESQLSFYKEGKLAVLAFASQAKGYFSKLAQEIRLSPKAAERYDCPENRKRFQHAAKLAQEKGVHLSSVILAFIYSHSFPAIPIIGCSNIVQLQDSLDFSDLVLTQAEMDYLNESRE